MSFDLILARLRELDAQNKAILIRFNDIETLFISRNQRELLLRLQNHKLRKEVKELHKLLQIEVKDMLPMIHSKTGRKKKI